MATYLVDYENVNAGGLGGIDKLDGESTVVIFYSQQADTLTFALHKKLLECRAAVSLIRVEGTSKNSLDFQLSSYLGYLIARDNAQDYLVVSKDNGFAVLCAFWKQNGGRVSQVANIQPPAQPAVAAPPDSTDRLEELLPQYHDDVPTIRDYLQKYKTKQGFNNALTKAFGSEKTGIIYRAVKPLLADKKGK